MKTRIVCFSIGCMLLGMLSSCSLFKPKYGCPSNGKNVGAERLLTGEKKLPKAKKFRS
jgi:hypothetical protein